MNIFLSILIGAVFCVAAEQARQRNPERAGGVAAVVYYGAAIVFALVAFVNFLHMP